MIRQTTSRSAVKRRLGLATSVFAVGAIFSHAASAQTASETDSPKASAEIQDVVVTATRRSTRQQTTAVAVSVIGGEQISQQNALSTRDLAGEAPGLFEQRAGITPSTEVFFIRGIGDSDPIFDPSVAQYVDDVYLPRAISGLTDLTDIERVEVLRGPQGTLFGENAAAGAIRYVTKTPSDTADANFDIGAGNFNTVNVHGYVAGALSPGHLDGSLAFAHDQHDGYTWDPTTRKYENNQNTTGVRGKLLAILAPDFKALLTVDATVDRSGAAFYVPEAPIVGGTLKSPVYGPYQPNVSYASQSPLDHAWTGGVSLKLEKTINPNLTLNSITAVRGFAQDPVNYNNDGQPLVPYSAAVPQPVSISDNYIVYKEKEATEELQLVGKYAKVDFTGGLYLLYEDFSSNRIGYVVSPTAATATPAYPEDQIGDTRTYNYSAYAQADYHLTDKWDITLGGRYTIEHRAFSFEGVYDTLSGVAITPVPGAKTTTAGGYAAVNDFRYQDQKTWESFTPKLGLSYRIDRNLFAYGAISTGFDAGGFNNRASSLATALPYDQDNVTTYELGLKSDWFEHRYRLNATVFYNEYDNLQETASVISPVTGGLVSVRANANRAHTDGVELENLFRPSADLTLTANVSYLETRFDSFPNASGSIIGGNAVYTPATGNQLPLSPHWQLYAAASYRVPLQIPGALKIGVDATYTSSYVSDVFNYVQGETRDQHFENAFISYKPANSRLLFTLNVRNIENSSYYQSITWGGTKSLWEGPQNPPQTVFIKVQYKL